MNVVVGVGSSGAQAEQVVRASLVALADHPLWRLRGKSRLYANPAIGGRTSARFVNGACVLETALSMQALVLALHAIEARFGRARGEKDAARSLDLDILLADGMAAQAAWPAVPHPRAADRPFAFVPGIEALERAELTVPVAWRAACARIVAPELVVVDEALLPRL